MKGQNLAFSLYFIEWDFLFKLHINLYKKKKKLYANYTSHTAIELILEIVFILNCNYKVS